MRRQKISKIGHDMPEIKTAIHKRGQKVLRVSLARMREIEPLTSPLEIVTELSCAQTIYQNPDLPDAGFIVDITFVKRNK